MASLVSGRLTTGLPGLDALLRGLIAGDNIVWHVERPEDYPPFVQPCLAAALERGHRVIYFRFARHEPLTPAVSGVEIVELPLEEGFEPFVNGIHRKIAEVGQGGVYLFDCLSDLAAAWLSDQMLGNAFLLICPYLYDVGALAYFALLRNNHAPAATQAILDTTQIFLDVYRHRGRLYLQPIKVQQRHSPSMYMLHEWKEDGFHPVRESATIAEIRATAPWTGLSQASHGVGVFDRVFLEAEKAAEAEGRGECAPSRARATLREALKTTISRDERMLDLAEKHFTIEDIRGIRRRMIGAGLIGGKSVGMLLARAILRQSDPRWAEALEAHDSFYIASSVFYTFLVQNGCWWARQEQQTAEGYMEDATKARQRILMGKFPEPILQQFSDMLDYFGQSPIIVRSSSLLEDTFGNSFVGKYESVFCANQGSRHKRLEDFLSAVRTVYASALGKSALAYRAQRGMLEQEEQMALLVQRVSGNLYGKYFYPHLAGVGFSFNPYVWNEKIDPEAGVLRLVFGLGTRAVDRSDDDYTRIVALNAPERRPEASRSEERKYTQRKADVLDLDANLLITEEFATVARHSPSLPIEQFATRDAELERYAAEKKLRDVFPWILSFERVLTDKPFVQNMRDLLRTLEEAYATPVDTEFTVNFQADGRHRINLVQCRPFHVARGMQAAEAPGPIPQERLVLEAHGAVIGQSRNVAMDRLIYVAPSRYGGLPVAERYKIARLIGELTRLPGDEGNGPRKVFLLGPGRWGTTTPSLGVPVNFAEIAHVAAICEIVAMREDLVPDVSLGTHFFNEMVELDMLYLALFPHREGNRINERFFADAPNRFAELLPSAAECADIIRVIDGDRLPAGQTIRLYANPLSQTVQCYLDRK